MSRVCQITGKKKLRGNHVSHANNKNIRYFKPNLHSCRFWLESEKRWIRLKVSHKAMRMIDRDGIESVISKLKSKGNL